MSDSKTSRILTLLLLGAAAGCGSDPGVTAPEGSPPNTSVALHEFSEWSTPVNVGPVVNSPFIDFTPEISTDGLSLYFSSDRPGGHGAPDLWVARRASLQAPWSAPLNLGPVINSSGNDGAPHLSRDGHRLFFTSNRPGGVGDNDVWVSWRPDPTDDLAWRRPVNLGPRVNSAAFDAGASLWRKEFYFTSNRETGDALDVYLSKRQGRGFGTGRLVRVLSSAGNDLRPSIRFDGREILLSSDREGSRDGSQDIWVSTRKHQDDRWSKPANLGAGINTEFQDLQPALSKDGTTLYFASDRPGGTGEIDLHFATRTRVPR
jgi:hypothetical protein